MKCDKCYWDGKSFNDNTNKLICVCEDENVHISDTQFSEECIGYLDKNFEKNMMDLFDECIELLSKKRYEQLLLVKEYLLKL